MVDLGYLRYKFLPGSGNSRTSFWIAALVAQVEEFWLAGSKRPFLVQLLFSTLSEGHHKFSPLILAIVRQSTTWGRGRSSGLSVHVGQLLSKAKGLSHQGMNAAAILPLLKAMDSGGHRNTPSVTNYLEDTVYAEISVYVCPEPARCVILDLFDTFEVPPPAGRPGIEIIL